MTELLITALRALGPAPSFSEEAAVAKAVLDSQDAETLELLDNASCEDLAKVAEDAGISALAALDFIAGLARSEASTEGPGGRACEP